MPDFLLIAVGALVPIVALTLALACGATRGGDPLPDVDVGDRLAEDARS